MYYRNHKYKKNAKHVKYTFCSIIYSCGRQSLKYMSIGIVIAPTGDVDCSSCYFQLE